MAALHSTGRCLCVLALLTAIVACGGGGERASGGGGVSDGGTLIIAASSDALTLMPTAVRDLQSKEVIDLVFEHLADFSKGTNPTGDSAFAPQLAQSWEWSKDSSSVAFHLAPEAKWHDGVPVRAEDVKFSFELTSDSVVHSPQKINLPAIASIEVPDSLTVVFHFAQRTPDRFFRLAYNLWILPKHLLDTLDRGQLPAAAFARHPVGSGPYRFVRWEPKSVIEVAANTTYHGGRPHIDRVIWSFVGDAVSGANKVVAGEADVEETIRPEVQPTVAGQPSVRLVPYANFDDGYVLFNAHDPQNAKVRHRVFGERGTREALALAIDRSALIRNAFDTLALPSRGPVARAVWSADTTLPVLAFDTVRSRVLLDSLGWRDTNGDGVRERDGVPLKFNVLTPSTSTPRRKMAVVLQEQWKKVGADASVQEVDPANFGKTVFTGTFDVFIHVLHGDPTPSSFLQSWGSAGESNFGGYSNPAIDSLALRAAAEPDLQRAKALYRQLYETLIRDVPAVFLYEPRNFAIVQKRLKFDTLRGDAWWMSIPSWYIPANERIARDKVPGTQ